MQVLALSGIAAAPFDKDTTGGSFGLFRAQTVDVIDMNKLREEGKKKTVSVDQFETNNLVFIDEAHRNAPSPPACATTSRLPLPNSASARAEAGQLPIS